MKNPFGNNRVEKMILEQKAKAYDEALERAKDWIDEREQLIYPREIVEEIFPELKEDDVQL